MALTAAERLNRQLVLLKDQLTTAEKAGDTDEARKLRAQIQAVESSLVSARRGDAGPAAVEPISPKRKENWRIISDLVTAPYRFVPLNGKVVGPEHPDLSLDRPVPDGGSAVIDVEWGIETPLLIGKAEGSGDQEAVVPLALGEKPRWVIPGATLRGLVRAAMEIVAFGRLRQVNGHFRFGLRDFTHPMYREDSPVSRDPDVRAGWLHRHDDGYAITPCAKKGDDWGFVKIKDLPNVGTRVDWTKKNRKGKRDHVKCGTPPMLTVVAKRPRTVPGISLPRMIYRPDSHGRRAELVVSGAFPPGRARDEQGKYIYDNENKPVLTTPKRFEYLLFSDPRAKPVPLLEPSWKRFEIVNCRQGRTRLEPEGAWEELSKVVERGGRVPVFYVGELENQDGSLIFGLTRLFKIPHRYSVADKVPQHLRARGREQKQGDRRRIVPDVDFVEHLFGYVYEEAELAELARQPGLDPDAVVGRAEARRGRVFFGFAQPVDAAQLKPWPGANEHHQTIAMAPRASYAPYYLCGLVKDWSAGLGESGLAGRKRYVPRYQPAALPTAADGIAERLRDPLERYQAADRNKQPAPRSVQTRLRFLCPVGDGAAFRSRIRLQNVTKAELGAVLWILTFGGDRRGLHRHMLGRAKAAGAGQVLVRRLGVAWRPNDEAQTAIVTWAVGAEETSAGSVFEEALVAFESWMEGSTGNKWRSSPTLRTYLALHHPGSWADLSTRLHRLLEQSGWPATPAARRVVARWQAEKGLAYTFLGRPNPDQPKQRAENDFQTIREATKLGGTGSVDPHIPLLLLGLPKS